MGAYFRATSIVEPLSRGGAIFRVTSIVAPLSLDGAKSSPVPLLEVTALATSLP